MGTLFIGKNTLFLLEVESTNTYAMNMLRNVNAIEGTVVYTDHQTKGKGQRGASWSSEIASNITASVILKPQFLSVENSFYLSKISALAVYDVLAEILPESQYDIKIKWPNDMLVNKRKIAGILIENNFNNLSIQHSVVGIGLNVNQTLFENLGDTVTSLQMITNRHFERNEVLESLCVHLEKWYLKLKELKFGFIDEQYMKHLFGLNRIMQFMDATETIFDGRITNITRDGKLAVEMADGKLAEFEVKQVKFVL
jgi:BirA family biotin operon repressor/biotin-[acetyl-CoA-carboxylase] ligase